jgi:hypothetical protein
MPGTPQPDSTGPGRSVRCPSCRREHVYHQPTFPCPCGASLKIPLLHGGVPVQVRFRSWEDSWLSMRCPQCGRSEQWPQPEFTCACGALVRLPVDTDRRDSVVVPPSAAPAPGPSAAPALPAGRPNGVPSPTLRAGTPPPRRRPFLPHPVRTSEDAVLAAARYLEWLGFEDLEVSESPEREGVCLLGRDIVAQVDTWTEPADLRAVECLWLNTLHAEQLAPAMFTLAGYSREALNRADQLLVALFELDFAGMPQPVNEAAEALIRTGATS